MHIREISALAAPLRDTLRSAGVNKDSVLGVCASNTPESVAQLLALWSLGATTWLCPLREPAHRIAELAKRVGIDLLLGQEPCTRTDKSGGEQLLLDVKESEARTLMNTSGSTGWPKFVEHDLRQHFVSARGVNQVMDFRSEHTWLLSLPLYHVGGLAILIRAIMGDASVAFSTEVNSVTHISLVATQLRRMLADEEANAKLAGMTRVALGGGPVPDWLKERASHLPILSSYGATEMASMWTAGIVGSGQLLPERELLIDESGEVRVRGPMLFKRYFDHHRTEVFDNAGFYKTSDMGRLDEQGNLHIVGRIDNMFISGGENIHPQEIELALLNHPLVEEAIVVGVSDAKWGQRPIAFARLSDFANLREGELKDYLRSTLPSFKIPDRFFDWPDHASLGLKPSRVLLRQRAEALLS